VSSSDISKSKTLSILGESLDLMSLESDENEDFTERLDGSPEQTKLLKRHMLAEAKTFRDLELLVIVLDSLEITGNMIDTLRK
jgi:nuclear pore complex protein Nup107